MTESRAQQETRVFSKNIRPGFLQAGAESIGIDPMHIPVGERDRLRGGGSRRFSRRQAGAHDADGARHTPLRADGAPRDKDIDEAFR